MLQLCVTPTSVYFSRYVQDEEFWSACAWEGRVRRMSPCYDSLWGAKCVKNTYKCYTCISPSDI